MNITDNIVCDWKEFGGLLKNINEPEINPCSQYIIDSSSEGGHWENQDSYRVNHSLSVKCMGQGIILVMGSFSGKTIEECEKNSEATVLKINQEFNRILDEYNKEKNESRL